MSRKLVVYFSASGVTAGVAQILSETIGADLSAIEPEIPYTKADLNWMDKTSRSSVEMNNQASRPAIAKKGITWMIMIQFLLDFRYGGM